MRVLPSKEIFFVVGLRAVHCLELSSILPLFPLSILSGWSTSSNLIHIDYLQKSLEDVQARVPLAVGSGCCRPIAAAQQRRTAKADGAAAGDADTHGHLTGTGRKHDLG